LFICLDGHDVGLPEEKFIKNLKKVSRQNSEPAFKTFFKKLAKKPDLSDDEIEGAVELYDNYKGVQFQDDSNQNVNNTIDYIDATPPPPPQVSSDSVPLEKGKRLY
jgi:hypothetical protein